MSKSMTAFARQSDAGVAGELVWELRSVNHRFLEPNLRLPEDLRALDPAVRERLNRRLKRGKVDCTLRFNPRPGALGEIKVNTRLVAQLVAAADQIAASTGGGVTPDPLELMRWPGVLEEPESDQSEIMGQALALLDRALDELVATREREGARIEDMILERTGAILASVERVRVRLPEVLAAQRQRLNERVAELAVELDPARLEQEIALVTQRLDVDEEMDRLVSHVSEVEKALSGKGPSGRRLDFLMQELNREANTLSSKSNDVEMTREAVEMKVLIEQMREQIQNLE